MARALKVCLVSPAPIWVNPRLRKEADALHAAGYDVVVGYRLDGDARRDDAILATKPWSWYRLDVNRTRAPVRWLTSALRERLAGMLGLDAEAYCRGYPALVHWAIAQRADLYIAHTQPALAIAAEAAKATGARYAFDCEDLLAEETADGLRSAPRREMIRRLERRYLPGAAYVSATSQPMADYLVRQYGLTRVHVWHNCFPRSELSTLAPPAARPRGETVDLAWMGATIGHGRGLEDVFAVLPSLDPRVRLYLYGNLMESHREWLSKLGERVVVRPLPPAAEVMPTLARHHIGLTPDRADSLNLSLTICNKFFLYLQSGLALVATDLPGQMSVLGPHAEIGAAYHPGDTDALASILRSMTDPATLAARQSAAWELGCTTYSWDVEQALFLDAVRASAGADEDPLPARDHDP
ncbi:MAG TPA: glycosyltransferase [Gemmatimonadaceae bacterium]|nr:glycosyltransferase [Gemmatimonadaceae bacterium]